MKAFGILSFISVTFLQIFCPINALVIGEPYSTPNALFEVSSVPNKVRQLAFDVVGSGRGPSSALSTNIPGGTNILGDSGLDVLRRGTLLVADALARVLGNISTLINMIQSYAQTGSIQFDNFSTSSQSLTNRLLNLGTNAATSIMNTFSNDIAIPGNNGASSSSSGINMAVPSTSQFIVSESTPVTQTQVDTGRQSNLVWPQGSMFPISASTSSSPEISGPSLSVSSSQPQFGGRLGMSTIGRPAVSVSNGNSANVGIPIGGLNNGGASGFGGISEWRGSGVGLSGWGDSVGGTSGWRGSSGISSLGGPGFISSWGGPSTSINSANVGITPGLSGSSASSSTLGWNSPSSTIGWRGPSGIAGWSGANGISGLGGAGGLSGTNSISGLSGVGGFSGWDTSGSFDTDMDGMDIFNGVTMYGLSNVNNTDAVPSLSMLMETLFSPFGISVNSTASEQTSQQQRPSSMPISASNSTLASADNDRVANLTLTN